MGKKLIINENNDNNNIEEDNINDFNIISYGSIPEKVIQVTSKDVYPDSDKLAIYPKKGISFHYDIYGKSVIMFVFSPAMFGK